MARALANVVPIAASDPLTGQRRQVAPIELLFSAFHGAATVLRKGDGTELRGLTVDRCEVESAVLILQHAGVRF